MQKVCEPGLFHHALPLGDPLPSHFRRAPRRRTRRRRELWPQPLTKCRAVRTYESANVSSPSARVRFEHSGSHLATVEIVRGGRSPIIASLHRSLVALGLVVSSYQARTGPFELLERVVFERRDGGVIEAPLGEAAKAVILELVIDTEEEPTEKKA